MATDTILFNQPDGTAITTAGPIVMTNGAGSTSTHSNLHPQNGVTGGKFSGAVSQNSVLRYTLSTLGSPNLASSLYYWYSGVAPATSERICGGRTTTGPSWFHAIDAAGKLNFQATNGTVLWTSAAALSAGLYRIEDKTFADTTTTGTARCAYYSGDSLSAVEESPQLTTVNMNTGTYNAFDIGRMSLGAFTADVFIDSVQMLGGGTNYLGIYPPAPSAIYTPDFAGLRAAGYLGSLSEMRRQNYLALLSLVEPQNSSNNDLELRYWRSIGKTGSIMDARHQP